LAAPLAAACTFLWGWRSAFAAGGVLGSIWVVAWIFVYRIPREHPRLGAEELALIEGDEAPSPATSASVSIRRILRVRETWGCVLARMLTDPISYFFIFWTPLFLQQERGFDLAAIGKYSGIPYIGLAIGNIAGGIVPGVLVRHGWTLNRARKTVMALSSLVIATCCLLIVRVPTSVAATVLISGAMFCHAAWANMTLPAEVFPSHVVATVSGFGGALGGLSGALSQQAIGWTVETISFAPVFAAISCLPLIAFGVVCFFIRRLGAVRAIPA